MCMDIHTHSHAHTRTHAHAYTHTHTNAHACTRTHTHIYMSKLVETSCVVKVSYVEMSQWIHNVRELVIFTCHRYSVSLHPSNRHWPVVWHSSVCVHVFVCVSCVVFVAYTASSRGN